MSTNLISYCGESKTLTEWACSLGIDYDTLWSRLRVCKWPVEKAFGTPLLRQGINLPRKRELQRAASKRLKARRLAAGLCTRCKSPVSETSKSLCERHRLIGLARDRQSVNASHKKKYWARVEAGLCAQCAEPVASGLTLCEVHNQANKRAQQKRKDVIAAYKRSIRAISNAQKRTEEYRAKRRAWRKIQRETNPAANIADRLRKRVLRAVRDYGTGRKCTSTAELIGCTIAELMAHLESLFLPGMTWENRNLWHVDHKRPAASYTDLSDPEQQRACFHFSNLQPLWAADNIRKHAKFAA